MQLSALCAAALHLQLRCVFFWLQLHSDRTLCALAWCAAELRTEHFHGAQRARLALGPFADIRASLSACGRASTANLCITHGGSNTNATGLVEV